MEIKVSEFRKSKKYVWQCLCWERNERDSIPKEGDIIECEVCGQKLKVEK